MEPVINLKQRKTWIDIYKGIAIILVVLGHLTIPQALYDFIFIFHMYAFFFISGITFKVKKEQSLGSFILDNITRLYIPYLFFAFAWDITNTVAKIYINKNFDSSSVEIIKNIASVIIGGGPFESSASIGPAWFLLALIFVRTVCWVTLKLSNNKTWVLGIVSVALFIVGYIFNGFDFLPLKIFSTLTAFIFVFAGYCAKNIHDYVKKVNMWLLLVYAVLGFAAAFAVSVFVDRSVVLVSNELPANPVFTLVGGFAGCFGIFFLSVFSEKIPALSKALEYYGGNSLVIMGMHSEINFVFRLIIDLIFDIPVAYRTVLIFALTLVLVVPICVIMNKYFPILIGKRRTTKAS